MQDQPGAGRHRGATMAVSATMLALAGCGGSERAAFTGVAGATGTIFWNGASGAISRLPRRITCWSFRERRLRICPGRSCGNSMRGIGCNWRESGCRRSRQPFEPDKSLLRLRLRCHRQGRDPLRVQFRSRRTATPALRGHAPRRDRQNHRGPLRKPRPAARSHLARVRDTGRNGEPRAPPRARHLHHADFGIGH